MKKSWSLIRLSVVIGLLIGLLSFKGVTAQLDTNVHVEPSDSSLFLNGSNTASIQIMVDDAYNLNGFDIRITYDPAVVTLTSWSHGGILQNLLRVIGDTNIPGVLRLVYVQRNTAGYTGDGPLLNLNFSGVAFGSSPITIEAVTFVTTPDNVEYHPTVENGTLSAIFDPSLLPQYQVYGSINLQGQSQRGGVVIALDRGLTYYFGPFSFTSTDILGNNLDFGVQIADTYQLTTNQPRYLNVHSGLNKLFIINEYNIQMDTLTLISGNAVWTDNVINTADASLVGAWYGKTTEDLLAGEVLDADVNFDGIVNLRDLAIVAGNYGLTAEAAYGSWEP